MRKVIVLSADLSKGRSCSLEMARELLQQGLARIIRFYPYTLQLKGLLDNGKESLEDDHMVPAAPVNTPPSLTKRLKLRMKPKDQGGLKIFQHEQRVKKPLKRPAVSIVRKAMVHKNLLENGVF